MKQAFASISRNTCRTFLSYLLRMVGLVCLTSPLNPANAGHRQQQALETRVQAVRQNLLEQAEPPHACESAGTVTAVSKARSMLAQWANWPNWPNWNNWGNWNNWPNWYNQ